MSSAPQESFLCPFQIGDQSERFEVYRRIGAGSFGEIYEGRDLNTGEKVAIKFERVDSKHPQLVYEGRVIRSVHTSEQPLQGFPVFKWAGEVGNSHLAMVVTFLGHSLEDLFNYCGRHFSLKTTLQVADQMVCRIQTLHSRHFIHRDIKPDNFLIGTGQSSGTVHIIDFGLSKRYRDPRTLQHIPYREGKNLTGTARYVSISTHLGLEQSRRDDLESLGYVFMYFLRGSLPWQGLRARDKKQKYQRIMEKKVATSTEALCRGYPDELRVYLDYCKSLGFEEEPDYAYCRRLLQAAAQRHACQYDGLFDWHGRAVPDSAAGDSQPPLQQQPGLAAVPGQQQQQLHDGGGQGPPRPQQPIQISMSQPMQQVAYGAPGAAVLHHHAMASGQHPYDIAAISHMTVHEGMLGHGMHSPDPRSAGYGTGIGGPGTPGLATPGGYGVSQYASPGQYHQQQQYGYEARHGGAAGNAQTTPMQQQRQQQQIAQQQQYGTDATGYYSLMQQHQHHYDPAGGGGGGYAGRGGGAGDGGGGGGAYGYATRQADYAGGHDQHQDGGGGGDYARVQQQNEGGGNGGETGNQPGCIVLSGGPGQPGGAGGQPMFGPGTGMLQGHQPMRLALPPGMATLPVGSMALGGYQGLGGLHGLNGMAAAGLPALGALQGLQGFTPMPLGLGGLQGLQSIGIGGIPGMASGGYGGIGGIPGSFVMPMSALPMQSLGGIGGIQLPLGYGSGGIGGFGGIHGIPGMSGMGFQGMVPMVQLQMPGPAQQQQQHQGAGGQQQQQQQQIGDGPGNSGGAAGGAGALPGASAANMNGMMIGGYNGMLQGMQIPMNTMQMLTPMGLQPFGHQYQPMPFQAMQQQQQQQQQNMAGGGSGGSGGAGLQGLAGMQVQMNGRSYTIVPVPVPGNVSSPQLQPMMQQQQAPSQQQLGQAGMRQSIDMSMALDAQAGPQAGEVRTLGPARNGTAVAGPRMSDTITSPGAGAAAQSPVTPAAAASVPQAVAGRAPNVPGAGAGGKQQQQQHGQLQQDADMEGGGAHQQPAAAVMATTGNTNNSTNNNGNNGVTRGTSWFGRLWRGSQPLSSGPTAGNAAAGGGGGGKGGDRGPVIPVADGDGVVFAAENHAAGGLGLASRLQHQHNAGQQQRALMAGAAAAAADAGNGGAYEDQELSSPAPADGGPGNRRSFFGSRGGGGGGGVLAAAATTREDEVYGWPASRPVKPTATAGTGATAAAAVTDDDAVVTRSPAAAGAAVAAPAVSTRRSAVAAAARSSAAQAATGAGTQAAATGSRRHGSESPARAPKGAVPATMRIDSSNNHVNNASARAAAVATPAGATAGTSSASASASPAATPTRTGGAAKRRPQIEVSTGRGTPVTASAVAAAAAVRSGANASPCIDDNDNGSSNTANGTTLPHHGLDVISASAVALIGGNGDRDGAGAGMETQTLTARTASYRSAGAGTGGGAGGTGPDTTTTTTAEQISVAAASRPIAKQPRLSLTAGAGGIAQLGATTTTTREQVVMIQGFPAVLSSSVSAAPVTAEHDGMHIDGRGSAVAAAVEVSPSAAVAGVTARVGDVALSSPSVQGTIRSAHAPADAADGAVRPDAGAGADDDESMR